MSKTKLDSGFNPLSLSSYFILSLFILSSLAPLTVAQNKNKRAIRRALSWLTRHQSDDGSWKRVNYIHQCREKNCKRYVDPAQKKHNVGVTGLAVLAYLNSGVIPFEENSDSDQSLNQSVALGLNWLITQQNKKGAFEHEGIKYMYDHAIATYAVTEAYRITKNGRYLKPAQKAIDYLMKAQNPQEAWRYTYQCEDNDTSVTSWCVQALVTGRKAGLQVKKNSLNSAHSFIRSATEKRFWQTGYRKKEDAGVKVRVPGKNELYSNHPSLTAIGMFLRIHTTARPNQKALKGGTRLLMDDLPNWPDDASPNSKGNPVDFYYWYFGSRALYKYSGPNGFQKEMSSYWKKWNNRVTRILKEKQNKKSGKCQFGSWDPISRWSFEGGRVYSTAINVLTLTTPVNVQISEKSTASKIKFKKMETVWNNFLKKGNVNKALNQVKKWKKQSLCSMLLKKILNGIKFLKKNKHDKAITYLTEAIVFINGLPGKYRTKFLPLVRKQEHLKNFIKEKANELGHKKYKTRESATKYLMKITELARPTITPLLNSDNPEVVSRAKKILEK